MPFKIAGDTSGFNAEVDSDKNLQVNLPKDKSAAGYVRTLSDQGTPFAATEDGHALVAEDTVVFFDQIDGTIIDTNKWNPYGVSGMTIAQSGGFITLNAGGATTANAYALLKTVDYVPFYPEFPALIALDLKLNIQPQANITIRFGIGDPAGASAPNDGVYYQLDPDGTTKAIVVNGGGTPSVSILGNVSSNVMHDYDISVEVDDANFIVDGTKTTIDNPAGIPFAIGTTRLPIFLQVINGSSAPSIAPQVSLGRATVIQKTLRPNRSWGEILTILGKGAYQSPTVYIQLPNWSNSAAPTTRTLSNTVPCELTLGGLLRFTPTYVADTDYVLFAYQVPTGYKLIINQVWYNSPRYFSGTAAATGSALQFGIGINSSAASLATADGTATWAPRRVPLGLSQLASLPSLLTVPSDVGQNIYTFPTGVVINSGRYLVFIARALLARTAGASEVHQMSVGFDGYFE